MLQYQRIRFLTLLFFGCTIGSIWTCGITQLTNPRNLVSNAHAIVRAKAISYEESPTGYNQRYYGIPESVIKFEVAELIKGDETIPIVLWINGYLNNEDDFNDHAPPYRRVRPNGRLGSCVANTYKVGAEYLLFLNSKYSPYWNALTPVNEQLRSPTSEDPWLQWVKRQVASKNSNRVHRLLF